MVKKYRVIIIPEALESLRKITDYVRRKSSKERSKYVLREIMKSVKSLTTFPEAHERVHDICTENITYRRVLQWDYRVIYTIEEEWVRVIIVEIVHGANDPSKLIDKFS
ncbi:MAG: type II toxin-antitoxin system RelE/ParE family toxin [Saprospiraceae bacterium]